METYDPVAEPSMLQRYLNGSDVSYLRDVCGIKRPFVDYHYDTIMVPNPFPRRTTKAANIEAWTLKGAINSAINSALDYLFRPKYIKVIERVGGPVSQVTLKYSPDFQTSEVVEV